MEESNPLAIANYLMRAAGIPSPWRATQCRIDEVAKIVHLWITRHPLPNVGKKRGWFGLGAAPAVTEASPAGPEMQWRHLNCMDYTCRIHTVDGLEERHHDLPWLGQPGLPFSNRLSRQIFACLMEGMEMSAICTLLNIPFTDLWKFKHALDNGHVRFDYTPAKKARNAAAAPALPKTVESIAAAAPAATLSAINAMPDVADPVWEWLLTGELNIQIKTLSFQLILTKLRQQVSLQLNDEVKLMKLRELHRYVERNERSLGHELRQLKELSRLESA